MIRLPRDPQHTHHDMKRVHVLRANRALQPEKSATDRNILRRLRPAIEQLFPDTTKADNDG